MRNIAIGMVLVTLVFTGGAMAYGQESGEVVPEKEDDLSAEVNLPSKLGWKALIISSVREVKSDLTIPSNICLKFENGGACDVKKGMTLTIRGPVEAPMLQIFQGSGRVIFESGVIERVYPQWWGAQTDDDGDDTAAIQAAIDSLSSKVPWVSQPIAPNGGVVFFPGGIYRVSSRLKIYDGTTLEGTPNRTALQAVKALPAIIQRADLTPPPAGTNYNIATRVCGARISNLSLLGKDSAVGLDLTNVGYSVIENVNITSCQKGILMGELSICNTFINPGVGSCETGIEINFGTMDNNIFDGSVGVVTTGLLINYTGQLNIYGMAFNVCKKAAVDIRGGGNINLHHPYFDLSTEEGVLSKDAVPVKIAPGVSSCTIVNPYFSTPTPRVIDNQSESTLILVASGDAETTLASDMLKTKALYTAGISATKTRAKNLRGQVTISGTNNSVPVLFSIPEPDDQYFVVATVVSMKGVPPSSAPNVFITEKSKEGFKVCLNVEPGTDNSVTVDWILIR